MKSIMKFISLGIALLWINNAVAETETANAAPENGGDVASVVPSEGEGDAGSTPIEWGVANDSAPAEGDEVAEHASAAETGAASSSSESAPVSSSP